MVDKKLSINEFTIEIDTKRNNDVLLQSIPGTRMRGAIKPMRTVKDALGPDPEEEVVPKDQARHLGSFPEVPGERLTVNPGALSYSINDPLRGDQTLCDRIQRWMEDEDNGGWQMMADLDGKKPREGLLDVDQIKTLCREMLNLIKGGNAKQIGKGVKIDLDDINDLPGDYLLNPGSLIANNQPRYEKDLEAYRRNLVATGG